MKYDVERAVVMLSVRELCEEALTRGDLDTRTGGVHWVQDRAVLGAKMHRKLQAEAGARYDAEVVMTNTTFFHGLCYEVSGRADGILSGTPPTVDEIKTVGNRAFLLPADPRHVAQAKIYAHFLCTERELNSVFVRLTYCCMEDEKIKHLTHLYTADELRDFYLSLLQRVEYRAKILEERQTVLLPSVNSGRFPFPSVRDGQDRMLRESYRAIRSGKRLFVQAPTGTGKTVSALYPAVRAIGEGIADKIFYLTAKASTRKEAYRAAEKIFGAGSHLRTAVLTAREQLCLNDAAKADPAGISRHCNPDDCPFAKGFYNRCPTAVCDLLSSQSGYSRAIIDRVAREYRICPYEFQLELSEFCDTLICDYNYAFDPQVYLRRYFEPEAVDTNRYIFLIDEAHNLGDRTCAMYSAELNRSDMEKVIALLPETDAPLKTALGKPVSMMTGFRRLCRDTLNRDTDGTEHGYYINRQPMEKFHLLISQTGETLERWLRTHRGDENEVAVYTLSTRLARFIVVSECYDEHFMTFIEVNGEELSIRLICLDPSAILNACLNRACSAVLFSATLTPLDYFTDILGGGRGALRLSLPSPFDPCNLCLSAVTGISTRYEDRNQSFRTVSSLIAATASAKAGNYIVYFPSYEYMEQVRKCFSAKYPKVPTVVQTRGMTAVEREHFLDAFREDGKLRIGFCVLGGSFSEGVDLPGRRLIGTVIVGTGLPGISNERNILRDYYDNTRERGFDYAYTYPGMNRVLQAAGRVIRREDDRGVIVLIDDRYGTEPLQSLFPEHWKGVQYAGNAAELAELVAEFWDKFL